MNLRRCSESTARNRGGIYGFSREMFAIFLFGAVFTLLLFFAGEAGALTADEMNNIEVYRKAAPSVVNISSVVIGYDYFYRPIPQEGVGSGAVVDEKGFILTNHHVVQDAQSLEVTLADGSRWPATLVGSDPDNDLAVIKVEVPDKKLVKITVGSSKDLKIGQKVLAIGNPFGLGQTMTVGVISSLGRSIRADSGSIIRNVVQTDAAVNPGNSGGPLLNSRGEMIGLNTSILSPTGSNVGIGFAVPVDAVSRILPRLISPGFYYFFGIRPLLFFVLIISAFYLLLRRKTMVNRQGN